MEKKRQVFFSFYYDEDNWRASQVRNMGKVDGTSTFSDNDWEEVKSKSGYEIKKWIDEQLNKRSCLVVLIGSHTSSRYWVNYEIERAYRLHKGIVGIYIHNLLDKDQHQSMKGNNPFKNVLADSGFNLSYYVKAYDSQYKNSHNVYRDIEDNIQSLIKDAIANVYRY